jgi:hypothetical protein
MDENGLDPGRILNGRRNTPEMSGTIVQPHLGANLATLFQFFAEIRPNLGFLYTPN